MKKDIQDETLLALKQTGHSLRKIEKVTGLSKSAIAQRLKHLAPTEATDIFKEHKSDILAEKQRQLLMSAKDLSPKEQRDIAVAFGVYADKEDRIRGLNPDVKPFIIFNQVKLSDDKDRDQ